MSEILLKCSCPARNCRDEKIRGWHHGDCPSNSNYYISDEGILRCDNCGKKFDFLSRSWKSSSCSHDYENSNLKRAINIFTALMMSDNNISAEFYFKICKSLKQQAAKYDVY